MIWMGVFLQYAIFPGSREDSVRKALETVSKNSDFGFVPEQCRCEESRVGTQVLLEGDFESAPFARTLSAAASAPVMLLYICDGDDWGYDFYAGDEEDHFHTIGSDEKRHLAGNPAMLARWFPVQDISMVEPYFVHWSEWDADKPEKAGAACSGDRFSYGDGWQVTDFAARLGFPWAFDETDDSEDFPLPALKEILEKNLPPVQKDWEAEEQSFLYELPSAFSPDYIRRLLREDGIQSFAFEDRTPKEIMDAVNAYRWSVTHAERDPLCQRLAVLGAFCAFWLGEGNPWGFLDNATYEPVCLRYEKPTDIYVLRARAAVTDSVKRHRARRDLNRLLELDPEHCAVYRAEMKRWEEWEKA